MGEALALVQVGAAAGVGTTIGSVPKNPWERDRSLEFRVRNRQVFDVGGLQFDPRGGDAGAMAPAECAGAGTTATASTTRVPVNTLN